MKKGHASAQLYALWWGQLSLPWSVRFEALLQYSIILVGGASLLDIEMFTTVADVLSTEMMTEAGRLWDVTALKCARFPRLEARS